MYMVATAFTNRQANLCTLCQQDSDNASLKADQISISIYVTLCSQCTHFAFLGCTSRPISAPFFDDVSDEIVCFHANNVASAVLLALGLFSKVLKEVVIYPSPADGMSRAKGTEAIVIHTYTTCRGKKAATPGIVLLGGPKTLIKWYNSAWFL